MPHGWQSQTWPVLLGTAVSLTCSAASLQVAQKTNADLLALWEGLTDAPTAEDTDATLDTVVQQLNADFEA